MDFKQLFKTLLGTNLVSVLTSLANLVLAPALFFFIAQLGLSGDMTIKQAIAAGVVALVSFIARMLGEPLPEK